MSYLHNITYFLVTIAELSTILFLNGFKENNAVMASSDDIKFSKNDFMIKDFGIDSDRNPSLTVEGNAGATIPKKENTGYGYLFVTKLKLQTRM